MVSQNTPGPSQSGRDTIQQISDPTSCLKEMKYKLCCPEQKTDVMSGNIPLRHHFHEYQVNTEPDLEDIMDIFKTSNQGRADNDTDIHCLIT